MPVHTPCIQNRQQTSYSHLRDNLQSVLDQVIENPEVVIVRRRGAKDVALIPAAELTGLIETAHLLRSPRSSRRLLTAMQCAVVAGHARPISPFTPPQSRLPSLARSADLSPAQSTFPAHR